jgi:hypothetical protein
MRTQSLHLENEYTIWSQKCVAAAKEIVHVLVANCFNHLAASTSKRGPSGILVSISVGSVIIISMIMAL